MPTLCSNCQFEETENAEFCSKCGQKFGPYILTIREFFRDLADHVFNLDTNFFRTLRRIFIPGQLTLDYFKGYRKRYFHPHRLFFVLLVLHLGAMGGLIPYDKIFNEITVKTNDVITEHKIQTELQKLAQSKPDARTRMAIDSVMIWFKIDKEEKVIGFG